MRFAKVCGAALLAGLAGLSPLPAAAQSPSAAATEPAEIASCLCLQRDMERLNGETAAKRRALDQLRDDLARIDAGLERERASIDVDDPQAVAQFRQELAQRDALFNRSTGPAAADLTAATLRFNAVVNQYNTQCAERPRDPRVLAQVQANLSCPAP
jgi:hypothetical protein